MAIVANSRLANKSKSICPQTQHISASNVNSIRAQRHHRHHLHPRIWPRSCSEISGVRGQKYFTLGIINAAVGSEGIRSARACGMCCQLATPTKTMPLPPVSCLHGEKHLLSTSITLVLTYYVCDLKSLLSATSTQWYFYLESSWYSFATFGIFAACSDPFSCQVVMSGFMQS